MTGPVYNNQPNYPGLQSQQLAILLSNMQGNPQAMALASEILRLATLSAKIEAGTSTLQERITFIDQISQLFPRGAEDVASPDQPSVKPGPTSWNQLLLNFFVGQLGAVVTEALDEMAGHQQGQAQIRKPAPKQSEPQESQRPSTSTPQAADPVNRAFVPQSGQVRSNETPPAMQNPTQQPNPASNKTNRQLFAETAVKLLSVNQLGQAHVGGQTTSSPHVQMAVQLNQIMNKLAELKEAIQNQKAPHLEAALKMISERIKGTLEALQQIIQDPQPKNATQNVPFARSADERLQQDFLLLSSLLSGAKAKETSNSDPNNPVAARQPGNQTLNIPVPPSLSKPVDGKPVLANPTAPQAKPVAPPELPPVPVAVARPINLTAAAHPLPIQAPSTNTDAIALIQAHLNKGIMQPLPIILPFPVTITREEALNISASAVGKEKAKNQGGEKRGASGGGSALSILTMLLPPGPVIFGDHLDEGRGDEKPVQIEQLEAFLIAATPVTNGQYAAWLSDELAKNHLRIEMPGKIYDVKGILLAHTIEGAPLSQLEISSEGGMLIIRALPGRENHPVVHVTYDGALAYCHANGFRLPSEYEWERAAGMLPSEYGQPLKKMRYGNGSDSVSLTTAVYKDTGMDKITMNMTMPVGFFDGQKVFTKAGKRIETKLSISPWGCYDMSGNAREWTSTSYDEEGYLMVTKGGSYADTAFDLRVAAKIPLPRQSSDPYTTFRVAF